MNSLCHTRLLVQLCYSRDSSLIHFLRILSERPCVPDIRENLGGDGLVQRECDGVQPQRGRELARCQRPGSRNQLQASGKAKTRSGLGEK